MKPIFLIGNLGVTELIIISSIVIVVLYFAYKFSTRPKAQSGNASSGNSSLVALLAVGLIVAVIYIILQKNGYSSNSILNTPETIDLTVNCSGVSNKIVTSTVEINVQNNSSRTHNNVTVRVTAYDKNDEVIKVKTTTFERTLQPNESLSKPVTLPAKTKRCDCVIESSIPE